MRTMNDVKNLMKEVFVEEYDSIQAGAEIAALVMKARLDRKFTQKQLAEKTGLTQSAIARIENKGAIPRTDTLMKIAKALNMNFVFVPSELRDSTEKSVDNAVLLEPLTQLRAEILGEIRQIKKEISLLASNISYCRQYQPCKVADTNSLKLGQYKRLWSERQPLGSSDKIIYSRRGLMS